LLAVEIDEHGDVVVAALGRRLIEAESLQPAEIEPSHGLPDVVLDDAPQPLVGNADDAGRRQYRHLAREQHRRLLEQEREPAPLRAHGAWIRLTPCSGQSVRGTLAVI